MNDIPEFVIRRILVALDASAHSLAALEEAAVLAAAMEAELMGLFVEDINLVRVAALPFARQISYPSGLEERLSSERIDRELKARAALVRKALAAVAERKHAAWSFRAVRGHVADEILAAASQADLILLGRSGWTPAQSLGSTARAVLAAAPGAFLLVQHEVTPAASAAGPIVAIQDGSGNSQRALEAAILLARARQVGLLVLVAGDTPEAADSLQQNAKRIIGGRLKEVRIRRLDAAGPREIAQAVRSLSGSFLVLPGGSRLAQQPGIGRLLELIRKPVLLIR